MTKGWAAGLLAVVSLFCEAAAYEMDHGPYLQELTNKGVSLMFTTSDKGVAWVEIKKAGAEAESTRQVYQVRDGLRQANNTFHSIRVEGLEPGESYEYRICSREIKKLAPYNVQFGESFNSPWYSFKTFSPQSVRCSLIAMSDVHDRPEQLVKLLDQGSVGSCDAVFLVGDMMSYCTRPYQAFDSYMDKCVEKFAKEKPFVLVRGNHETRGPLAREFSSLVPRQNGRIYGSQQIGDCFCLFLDAGEDKPDTHSVYAGLTDFDQYRTEQAEWLKEVVGSREFKNARHRVVFSHFPVSNIDSYNREHGMGDFSRKAYETLNNAGIDLMISGHTHQFAFHPAESGESGRKYPVLVGSDRSAARLDVGPEGISVKAYDMDGKVLLEKKLE